MSGLSYNIVYYLFILNPLQYPMETKNVKELYKETQNKEIKNKEFQLLV